MKLKSIVLVCVLAFSLLSCAENAFNKETQALPSQPKLQALILDGQNNHGVWPKTTMMMRSYLEDTDLFEVDIYRAKYTYQGPHHGVVDGNNHDSIKKLLEIYKLEDGKEHIATDTITPDPDFNPDFSKYDVIVSNFGMDSSEWPAEVKLAFETYIKKGGGLVVVHAANNSFGDWDEYNKMIGVGGWGHRDLQKGNQIFYDDKAGMTITSSNGEESSHGPEAAFLITTRAPEHPVMNGLPLKWLHTKDELYDRLRGPAENVTVLATAYSDVEANSQPWAPDNKGSGRDEPLLMVIDYGKGRTFHTALGHMDYSMEGVGFITTLQRGAEWAATGKVAQEIPADFPEIEKATKRSWND